MTNSIDNKTCFDVLLIGAGQMGMGYASDDRRGDHSSHVSTMLLHPGFRLAGVVDPRLDSSQFHCPHYADLREVSSKSYDLAVIATPSETHFPLLKSLLQDFNLRVILCEKPGASTARELQEIEALAQKKAVKVAVNYTRAWVPAFSALAEKIKRGMTPGAHFSCFYTKGLLNYASHQLNFLLQIDPTWTMLQQLTLTENPSFMLRNSAGATAYFTGLPDQNHDYELWTIQAYLKSGFHEIRAGGKEWSEGIPRDGLFFNGYTHLDIKTEGVGYHLDLKELYEDLYANLTGKASNFRCSLREAIGVLEITDQILTKEKT